MGVEQPVVEPAKVATLTEIFERRQAAVATVRVSEIAIRGLLNRYRESGRLICIDGYPAVVGLPHKSDTGEINSYTEIGASPLIGEDVQSRRIPKGTVYSVEETIFGGSVAVRPEGADNYWVYPFSSILELRIAEEPQDSSLSPEA